MSTPFVCICFYILISKKSGACWLQTPSPIFHVPYVLRKKVILFCKGSILISASHRKTHTSSACSGIWKITLLPWCTSVVKKPTNLFADKHMQSSDRKSPHRYTQWWFEFPKQADPKVVSRPDPENECLILLLQFFISLSSDCSLLMGCYRFLCPYGQFYGSVRLDFRCKSKPTQSLFFS